MLTKATWFVLIATALIVIIYVGPFQQIIYQISVTGQDDATAPAVMVMALIPAIYGGGLYVINTSKRPNHLNSDLPNLGRSLMAMVCVLCQLYLGYLALAH